MHDPRDPDSTDMCDFVPAEFEYVDGTPCIEGCGVLEMMHLSEETARGLRAWDHPLPCLSSLRSMSDVWIRRRTPVRLRLHARPLTPPTCRR